ncbi:2-phosphosulfolactate phosphatase family protein [Roseofilum sp. BLCC_M154]|uniref:Probable 2-phosphosulfolactate phosphatase n=1 Tax=Roseofilum acuticapitatum BLCC-M154 TaxID=3022444 RepID=A0ABT7AXP8_9CYAN|nr:2-phosphosulfolactate phosphatase family protein [Roseofilum acuticapitatum]MDJ1171693.1 2-phosphosulfolactate phosphatase family protein [Roseofilum acuticapitatum BLCC-M154]
MKLFVYHTPELTPTDRLPECAIAVDVLRATTTMATALHAGAEAVQVFSDIQKLMDVSSQWPQEKRLRFGERGGAKVEGCDLGNSPLSCTPEVVKEKRIFMSTTNGTRALQRVEASKTVVTGALINRQSVVNYITSQQPESIWIVGSGWEGSFSLEDTVCAGAIAHSLLTEFTLASPISEVNDEAIAAVALYRQWQERLVDLLQQASHGKRLLGLNGMEDIEYCAQLDSLNVLPIQKEPGVLVSHH